MDLELIDFDSNYNFTFPTNDLDINATGTTPRAKAHARKRASIQTMIKYCISGNLKGQCISILISKLELFSKCMI